MPSENANPGLIAVSEPELGVVAEQEVPASVRTEAPGALESTAMRATFWIVIDYGFSQGIRLVSSLILTHLLMPEVFGLMSLVSTLMIGISLLSDVGLASSVIQSPRGDDPVFLNTTWTVQVVRGLGIFVVAAILAKPMAIFYHEPRLFWLLIVLGAEIIVDSFKSTNLLTMARHMGVRRQFFLDTSTQLLGLILTTSLAWHFKSVWSLVIGVVSNTAYKAILSHNRRIIPGIRNTFCWERKSVRELVHFGRWILLSTALFFFASQADKLILGKLISFSMLGIYGIAYSVSDLPRQIMSAFTNRVGFPFVAKMAHKPIDEFRKTFLHYRFLTLLGGAFLLSGMVFLGGALVVRVWDHRYHDAAWMVPILSLGLWHTLLYSTTYPALLSFGKSKYGAIGNGCFMVSIMTAIPVGFHFFGMFGAVVAVAAGDFPVYVVYTAGASQQNVSTWRQDLQATAVFLTFLCIGFAIRRAIGA